MAALKYWVWLTALPGLSNRSRLLLLERYGSPEDVYYADPEELAQVEGLTPGQAALLADKSLSRADRILADCARGDMFLLTMQDAAYPARLRAKGIDGAAMRGALQAGGFTAAVLGGGVDVVYPAENRRLYEDIAATGVLLSEYPPGTEPLPGHFPVRNRIISGLSLAALVVEAPVRSGALITAHAALDQGRDVFAVPGPIDAAASVGCNRLIRDGAGLAASGWDILSVYHSRFPHRLHPAQMTVPEPGETPRQEESPPPAQKPEPEAPAAPELPVLDLDRNREGLTDDQLALIRVLDTETPLLTDEAAEQTGLPVRRVLSALTVLEIDGYAQRSGPRSYVRTVRLHSEKEGS